LKGGNESIFVVNPDGSGLRDLHVRTAASECAIWSPDGKRIAFCGHEGDGNWAVWVMNADGSHQQQLTHPDLVQPAGTGGDYPCAAAARRCRRSHRLALAQAVIARVQQLGAVVGVALLALVTYEPGRAVAVPAGPWHGCIADADRARALRFDASDGARLVGAG